MHTYTQEQRDALIEELSVAAGLLSVGQVRDWDDLSETLKCAANMLAAPSTSPLNDEIMWKLWNAQGVDEMNQPEAIAFGRAVEAAHGIALPLPAK